MTGWRPMMAMVLIALPTACARLTAVVHRDDPDEAHSRMVRCESRDRQVDICTADGNGDVRLARQLSEAPCVRGRSWGVDARGLWVSDGCRGMFALGAMARRIDDDRYSRGESLGYGGGVQVLRCESDGKRNHQCAVGVSRGVSLQRQLSAAPCVEGRTWGWSNAGIWVDQGCRGEFAIR